jgi:hypothetical protein
MSCLIALWLMKKIRLQIHDVRVELSSVALALPQHMKHLMCIVTFPQEILLQVLLIALFALLIFIGVAACLNLRLKSGSLVSIGLSTRGATPGMLVGHVRLVTKLVIIGIISRSFDLAVDTVVPVMLLLADGIKLSLRLAALPVVRRLPASNFIGHSHNPAFITLSMIWWQRLMLCYTCMMIDCSIHLSISGSASAEFVLVLTLCSSRLFCYDSPPCRCGLSGRKIRATTPQSTVVRNRKRMWVGNELEVHEARAWKVEALISPGQGDGLVNWAKRYFKNRIFIF